MLYVKSIQANFVTVMMLLVGVIDKKGLLLGSWEKKNSTENSSYMRAFFFF